MTTPSFLRSPSDTLTPPLDAINVPVVLTTTSAAASGDDALGGRQYVLEIGYDGTSVSFARRTPAADVAALSPTSHLSPHLPACATGVADEKADGVASSPSAATAHSSAHHLDINKLSDSDHPFGVPATVLSISDHHEDLQQDSQGQKTDLSTLNVSSSMVSPGMSMSAPQLFAKVTGGEVDLTAAGSYGSVPATASFPDPAADAMVEVSSYLEQKDHLTPLRSPVTRAAGGKLPRPLSRSLSVGRHRAAATASSSSSVASSSSRPGSLSAKTPATAVPRLASPPLVFVDHFHDAYSGGSNVGVIDGSSSSNSPGTTASQPEHAHASAFTSSQEEQEIWSARKKEDDDEQDGSDCFTTKYANEEVPQARTCPHLLQPASTFRGDAYEADGRCPAAEHGVPSAAAPLEGVQAKKAGQANAWRDTSSGEDSDEAEGTADSEVKTQTWDSREPTLRCDSLDYTQCFECVVPPCEAFVSSLQEENATDASAAAKVYEMQNTSHTAPQLNSVDDRADAPFVAAHFFPSFTRSPQHSFVTTETEKPNIGRCDGAVAVFPSPQLHVCVDSPMAAPSTPTQPSSLPSSPPEQMLPPSVLHSFHASTASSSNSTMHHVAFTHTTASAPASAAVDVTTPPGGHLSGSANARLSGSLPLRPPRPLFSTPPPSSLLELANATATTRANESLERRTSPPNQSGTARVAASAATGAVGVLKAGAAHALEDGEEQVHGARHAMARTLRLRTTERMENDEEAETVNAAAAAAPASLPVYSIPRPSFTSGQVPRPLQPVTEPDVVQLVQQHVSQKIAQSYAQSCSYFLHFHARHAAVSPRLQLRRPFGSSPDSPTDTAWETYRGEEAVLDSTTSPVDEREEMGPLSEESDKTTESPATRAKATSSVSPLQKAQPQQPRQRRFSCAITPNDTSMMT